MRCGAPTRAACSQSFHVTCAQRDPALHAAALPTGWEFFCSKHSQSARLDTGIKKKVVDLMVSSSASPWLMSSSCITFIGQDVTAAKKVLGSAAVG